MIYTIVALARHHQAIIKRSSSRWDCHETSSVHVSIFEMCSSPSSLFVRIRSFLSPLDGHACALSYTTAITVDRYRRSLTWWRRRKVFNNKHSSSTPDALMMGLRVWPITKIDIVWRDCTGAAQEEIDGLFLLSRAQRRKSRKTKLTMTTEHRRPTETRSMTNKTASRAEFLVALNCDECAREKVSQFFFAVSSIANEPETANGRKKKLTCTKVPKCLIRLTTRHDKWATQMCNRVKRKKPRECSENELASAKSHQFFVFLHFFSPLLLPHQLRVRARFSCTKIDHRWVNHNLQLQLASLCLFAHTANYSINYIQLWKNLFNLWCFFSPWPLFFRPQAAAAARWRWGVQKIKVNEKTRKKREIWNFFVSASIGKCRGRETWEYLGLHDQRASMHFCYYTLFFSFFYFCSLCIYWVIIIAHSSERSRWRSDRWVALLYRLGHFLSEDAF